VSTRKPPTTDQIVQTLLNTASGRLQADRTALSWDEAQHAIQREHGTNRDKAAQWLLDALKAPDSFFVCLSTSGRVMTSRNAGGIALTNEPFCWPERSAEYLNFDPYGRQLPVEGKHSQRSASLLHIVRRDQLPAMRRVIETQLAEMDRERAEENAAELAAFRALHGDALDVIQSVIDKTPAAWYSREGMMSTHMFETGVRMGLYSDSAMLTITLHADEIDAFAAQLRKD